LAALPFNPESDFFLIAGPCVLESEELGCSIAAHCSKLAASRGINYIFKASYDKANRSSIASYRGPGIEAGMAALQRIKTEVGCLLLSDIHEVEQAEMAAQTLDVLQIPAFLCRQTDLVLAAAATKKPLNIKKGQFMAPADMKVIVEKAASAGAEQILLTERGTTFGYHDLVVDFRSLPQMKKLGYPVVFDATHSVQQPGGLGDSSGGAPEYIETLTMAAVAAGCNGLFIEVHPEPAKAKSDAACMLPLERLEPLLDRVLAIRQAIIAI
jgi:2-dehydro-3-deoxyphosphooctonate aldolase (KDO 8-P synthase)